MCRLWVSVHRTYVRRAQQHWRTDRLKYVTITNWSDVCVWSGTHQSLITAKPKQSKNHERKLQHRRHTPARFVPGEHRGGTTATPWPSSYSSKRYCNYQISFVLSIRFDLFAALCRLTTNSLGFASNLFVWFIVSLDFLIFVFFSFFSVLCCYCCK